MSKNKKYIFIAIIMALLAGGIFTSYDYILLWYRFKIADYSKIPDKKRGDIYDSEGNLLAASVESYSVYIDPLLVKDKGEVLDYISNYTGLKKYFKLKYQDSSNKRFMYVFRERSKEEAFDFIKHFPEKRAVGVVKEWKRKSLITEYEPVVGMCDVDEKGITGIEYTYDDRLKKGEDIYITLNRKSQLEIYETLKTIHSDLDIAYGLGIEIENGFGRINALVFYPTYKEIAGRRIILSGNPAVTFNFPFGDSYKKLVNIMMAYKHNIIPKKMIMSLLKDDNSKSYEVLIPKEIQEEFHRLVSDGKTGIDYHGESRNLLGSQMLLTPVKGVSILSSIIRGKKVIPHILKEGAKDTSDTSISEKTKTFPAISYFWNTEDNSYFFRTKHSGNISILYIFRGVRKKDIDTLKRYFVGSEI